MRVVLELMVDNVSKHYGRKKVFENFSCKFNCGINSLLGANGTGKSTLLNLIATTQRSNCGSILFDGKDILKNENEYRKLLGYVPQAPPSYASFTAYEFLEYMCLLKEIPKNEIHYEITKVLDIVRLSNYEAQKIKTYSGGMRQRLSIAQAFLGCPKIMILDEPTVGLDPKERIIFKQHLTSVAKEKIILISTHIVSDVEEMSDKIFMLWDGKIVIEGTENEIISAYSHKGYDVDSLNDVFLSIYD